MNFIMHLHDWRTRAALVRCAVMSSHKAEGISDTGPHTGQEAGRTHFGYESVDVGEKAGRVMGVFSSVASKYDVMNDLMSAGMHRLWKRRMIDVAAVCGVEKMTEATGEEVTSGLATAADADYEVAHGVTFVALNALLMQRYMYEYKIPHEAFGIFSLNAHRNAVNNPNAMFRSAITEETYRKAPVIAPPVNLYDSSPICDGAAAVIVAPLEMARALSGVKPVRVLASASATDCLNLDDRRDLLGLEAAQLSAQRAFTRAGVTPEDIDVFEVHDAFSIIAALSLEASGFVARATPST